MTPLSRVLKRPRCEGNPEIITAPVFPELECLLPGLDGARRAAPDAAVGCGVPDASSDTFATADVDTAQREAERALAEAREEAAALRREAESLLAQARQQVDEFLRDAREQARAIQAEARAEGFQQGLLEAREAQKVLLADLEAMRDALRVEREQFFEDLEPEVVRLALAVAEKVIRQEVDLHPEIVVGVARAALQTLKEARIARVSAHPSGVDALRQHLAASMPGAPTELTVHASDAVSPGGCVVDSDRGSVDARVETQMEQIATALGGGAVE